MLSFGGGGHHQAAAAAPPPPPQQQPADQDEEEKKQVVRRLTRKQIQVPDFHDPRGVGVCLAAIQRRVEEKHAEAAGRRRARAEAMAGFSAASGLGEGPRQPSVADLAARVRAYEKEAERLRGRLRREEVELDVLEEAAPPPPLGGGGEGPVQVLARVLARAEEALAQRDRLRSGQGGDDEAGEEEEAAAALCVSGDPVGEARRFVERQLMGVGGSAARAAAAASPQRPSSSSRLLTTAAPADRRRAMMAARSGRRRAAAAVYDEDEEEEDYYRGPPEALI